MKKQQGKDTPNFKAINTSVMPLDYGRRQNLMGSLETMGDDDSNARPINQTYHSKESADDMNKELYRPATYDKALQFKRSRSYLKKADGQYKELDLFGDTEELKYFGLGVYFYIELFRRFTWLFLAMTLIQGITIIINFKGDGLSNYESSFSTYLIKTTLGNYSGSNTLTSIDTALLAALPAANFLALLIFAFIWRVHRRRAISKQEEDNTDVKPEKFAIQFQGFEQEEESEEDVKKFFSSFGPVFEASLVRNHENTLEYFQELDEIEEEIREQEHAVVLGGGSEKQVEELKERKRELQKRAMELAVHPTTISAFVHFQFQKSKKACLDEFNRHYLYAKCSHNCCRTFCCCCLPQDAQQVTFKNNKLLVRTEKVPAPEDINWEHFQISSCSKIARGCLAFFVILLFLAISCAIIGLCSLYITSHSNNCEGLNISSYTAASATASGSTLIMQCYCNAHLVDSFTDSTIKTACTDYLTGIYIEQSIQYVVIITSSLTNFLFGLVVDKLITCVRPASQGAALSTKTIIYTLFLILNSVVVPLLIYADIFGFQASSYVSFLTIISSNANAFFQASSISLYPNFTPVWYRNVSPVFTNFLIFNTLMVWLFFLLEKCCFASNNGLQSKEGKVLQKRMNRDITAYRLDICKETASLYLVVVMALMFSSGIPILLALALLNLLSRYIANRSLLQHNSVRVEGLGEEFSSLSSLLLTIILIAFPLLNEWMLIANTKIASDAALMFGSISSAYGAGIYELQMELYLPFYLAISLLAFLEYISFHCALSFCSCLCACCENPPPNFHTRPFWEYAKGMNILTSYNVRKNDKMRNAVLYLEKYLGEKPKI